jgi:hypothetical protein
MVIRKNRTFLIPQWERGIYIGADSTNPRRCETPPLPVAGVCPPLPRCVAGRSLRAISRGAGLACADGQQGSSRT